MWTWLNDTPVGSAVFSYIKVFITVVLGLFLADGADVFSVDSSDLRTWLAAGFAAVLPVIINAVNPNDPRYGLLKGEETIVFNEPVDLDEPVGKEYE